MSAAALKKPDQAEMLAELARTANLEAAGPAAKAAYDRLAASIWTAEDRERGRELGREAISLRAKELRILMREEGIKLVMDNYDCGNYIFRPSLVQGLHSYCVTHGLKGKGGRNVQMGTISRWLSEDIEAGIRMEAIARLISRRA
jgi:hypothetical protein